MLYTFSFKLWTYWNILTSDEKQNYMSILYWRLAITKVTIIKNSFTKGEAKELSGDIQSYQGSTKPRQFSNWQYQKPFRQVHWREEIAVYRYPGGAMCHCPSARVWMNPGIIYLYICLFILRQGLPVAPAGLELTL